MRPSPPHRMGLRRLPRPIIVRHMRPIDADPLPAEIDHPAVIDALADLEEGDRPHRTDQPARP